RVLLYGCARRSRCGARRTTATGSGRIRHERGAVSEPVQGRGNVRAECLRPHHDQSFRARAIAYCGGAAPTKARSSLRASGGRVRSVLLDYREDVLRWVIDSCDSEIISLVDYISL